LVNTETGATVAVVREGTPLETYDPGFGWRWPIWVGSSWLVTSSFTDHVRGRTFDSVKIWYKVAAYEDVTVPAGTFKTWRVDSDAGGGATITTAWWNPDLGITVKFLSERTSGNYQGAGTRNFELKSFTKG
jgi:hypothetical protein